MRIQGIPQDKTPGIARFAGGAGQGVQGFLQGIAGFQALEQRERELTLREQNAARREAMLQLSLGRTSLAYDRQRFQEAKALRDEDTKKREKAASQRATGSVLDAMRAKYGKPAPQGFVGPPAPGAQSALPPEVERMFQSIQDDPDLSIEDRAEMTGIAADLAAAGARDSAAKELAAQIQNEIAAGFWTPENGLGLQIDVDGDGKPDDWSDAPNKLLFLLGEGKIDPAEVAQIHEGLKRAGVQQRATLERRTAKVAEAQALVQANGAGMTPEGSYAAADVISRYQRGEFGDDQFGEQEFQRELGAAMQGMVFVEGKNGIRYAVPYDQAAQAELDLKGPAEDPTVKAFSDIATLADRVFPPFTPPRGDSMTPVSAAEVKAARDEYTKDKLAFIERFATEHGVRSPAPVEAPAAERAERYGSNLMRGIGMGGPPALPGPASKAAAPAPAAPVQAPAPRGTAWTALDDATRTTAREALVRGEFPTDIDLDSIPEDEWAAIKAEAAEGVKRAKSKKAKDARSREIRSRTRGMDS